MRVYDDSPVQTAKRPTRVLESATDSVTTVSIESARTDTATLDTASVDGTETAADTVASDTGHVTVVGADPLHAQGITGAGVTLAVLDTGFFNQNSLTRDTSRQARILAQYDAIAGAEVYTWEDSDGSGHGTHVTGIASTASSSREDRLTAAWRRMPTWWWCGPSTPTARAATPTSFAASTGWWPTRTSYGIRVLNLSFSAPPQSHYWDDPLNQAVMAAWQAGIVVVASAGNTGPEPMTIGVPGNVPYVITVGRHDRQLHPG